MITDFCKQHCKSIFTFMLASLILTLILDFNRRNVFLPLILIPFCGFFLILYLFYKFLAIKKVSSQMELSVILVFTIFIVNFTSFLLSPKENYVYGEGNCIIFSAITAFLLVAKNLNLSGSFGKDGNDSM